MQGTVKGAPKVILRLEGMFVLLTGVFAYFRLDAGWSMFFWCFLVPDLSFLGYLLGPRVGAAAYNFAHAYVVPLALVLIGASVGPQILLALGCIWICHIGLDRALGFGLKYGDGFAYTHLGLIGKR